MVIDMATSAFGVGSTLFYPNSPFHDTIVVKENISCAMVIVVYDISTSYICTT